jgi:hypothetical protein
LPDLDPESAEELDQLCKAQGKAADKLRQDVARVCENPSGQRDPRHRFTKKFHSAHRYVNVAKGAKVMEFNTNQWRALFQLVEVKKGKTTHRLVVFIPIKGQRFYSADSCPWH